MIHTVKGFGCDGRTSAAERSYPMPKVRGGAERSNHTSKEQRLCRCRRAERSYSTFRVMRGDLIQGKGQWLCLLEPL